MVAAEVRWWSANTVAVVTGANKGVGLELARQLARNGLTTVVTARDPRRGGEAVEALRKEIGESEENRIAFHPLDVCSEESANTFSTWLKQTYGGADILINNAGVLFSENESAETDMTTLQTNYYGVKNVTKAVLPVLREGARVIIVSSGLGQLHSLGNHYRKEFANRDGLTEAKVDEFVEAYLQESKTGKGIGGWPRNGMSPSYCVSKMAVNAYMSVLAREGVCVNSFTPGYTGTTMTGNRGHSVEDGAMTGVWLALHPKEGYPVGKFWSDKCRGEMSF